MPTNPSMVIRVAANLDELKRNLAEGKPLIETTTAAMSKLAASLDGNKLIQNAMNIVAAVDKVGVSTLTAAQAGTQLSVLERAMEKMALTGKPIPDLMGATAGQLRAVAEQANPTMWERLGGALGSVGLSLSGLGSAGIVAGVVGLGKQAIGLAGHIADLSAATGLSYEGLQKLAYAGDQVGVSMDQVAAGVQKFQRGIVEGGKPATEALQKLRISASDLLRMSPDAAFEAVAVAIAKIPDPAQRTAIAMELLRNSGANLLPLLTANIKDLEKGVIVMSDRTVENLDRAGDWWSRFKTNRVAEVGEMLGALTSWQEALRFVSNGAVDLTYTTDEANKKAGAMIDQLEKGAPKIAGLVPPLRSAKDAEAEFTAKNKDAEASMKRAWGETDSYKAKIQALADTFSGKAIAAKVDDLSAALKLAGGEAHLTAYEHEQLGKQLVTLHDQGAPIPGDLRGIWREAETLRMTALVAGDSVGYLTRMLKGHDTQLTADTLPTMDRFLVKGDGVKEMLKDLSATAVDLKPPPIDPWLDFKADAKSAIERLGGDVSGAFVGMLTGAVGLKDGFLDIWHSMIGTARDIMQDFVSNVFNRFLDGMIGMVLGKQGAMSSAFGGLFSGIGGGGGSAGFSLPGVSATGVGLTPAAGAPAAGSAAAGASSGLGAAAGIALGVGIVGAIIARPGYWGEKSADVRTREEADRLSSDAAYVGKSASDYLAEHAGEYGVSQDDLSALGINSYASGGYVPARPGGTIVRVGEGGQGEYITPEGQAPMAQTISFGDIHITGGSTARETAYALKAEIQGMFARREIQIPSGAVTPRVGYA